MSRKNRKSKIRRERNKEKQQKQLVKPTEYCLPQFIKGAKTRAGHEIKFDFSGIPLPHEEGKGLADVAAVTNHLLNNNTGEA